MTSDQTYLSTAEVAELFHTEFGISETSVRRWVRKGQLKPAITLPSGRMRFRREDVEAILRGESNAA